MHCQRPFHCSSLLAGSGARLLLLMGILVLFGTGCGSTTDLVRSPTAYQKVTTEVEGKTVRLYFRDRRSSAVLKDLYVGVDSTTGASPVGTERAVPTGQIWKIEIVNHKKGILQGIGLGALPFAIGFPVGAASESLDGVLLMVLSAAASLVTVPIGGVLGGVEGVKETYRLSGPIPEADSTTARLRHSPAGVESATDGQP